VTTFSISDMSARALGVDGNKVDFSRQDSAQKSITTIDEAVKKVSKERGKMGAIQNRL
jgi:flagellin